MNARALDALREKLRREMSPRYLGLDPLKVCWASAALSRHVYDLVAMAQEEQEPVAVECKAAFHVWDHDPRNVQLFDAYFARLEDFICLVEGEGYATWEDYFSEYLERIGERGHGYS